MRDTDPDEYTIGIPRDPGLERARTIARLFDSRIPLPGGLRVGLDGIIGVIPGVGDLVTATVGLVLIGEGLKRGMPLHRLAQMVFNLVLDTGAGVVPGVGDVFDFFWKSNQRNLTILEDYLGLERTFSSPRRGQKRSGGPRDGPAASGSAAAATRASESSAGRETVNSDKVPEPAVGEASGGAGSSESRPGST
jgi:hypothetical protein